MAYWQCQQCLHPHIFTELYMNDYRCFCCHASRPIIGIGSELITYDQIVHDWRCTRCTLRNPLTADKCGACEAPRKKPSNLEPEPLAMSLGENRDDIHDDDNNNIKMSEYTKDEHALLIAGYLRENNVEHWFTHDLQQLFVKIYGVQNTEYFWDMTYSHWTCDDDDDEESTNKSIIPVFEE